MFSGKDDFVYSTCVSEPHCVPDTVLVAEEEQGRRSHHPVAAVAWCGAGRMRHVRAGRAILCKMVRERPSDAVTGEQRCGWQKEESQKKKKKL